MFSAAKRHTMEKIASAPLRREPFVHMVVGEIFPPDFYAEMQARKLSDRSYIPLKDTGRVGGNYSPARLCFMQDSAPADAAEAKNVGFWKEFIATYNDRDFLDVWRGRFEKFVRAPALKQATKLADDKIGLQTEMFLMRDKETYTLGPHTDSASKAISALFYLPADDSNVMLGTSLYTPKDKDEAIIPGHHMRREFYDLVATIPYRPNAMLAFPNVPGSLHGVEPLSGAAISRDILLYDVKFTSLKARA